MQTTMEKTSTLVAAAAVSSIFIPPWLHLISQWAAVIMPIIGLAWLVWQFGWSIRKSIRKAKQISK